VGGRVFSLSLRAGGTSGDTGSRSFWMVSFNSARKRERGGEGREKGRALYQQLGNGCAVLFLAIKQTFHGSCLFRGRRLKIPIVQCLPHQRTIASASALEVAFGSLFSRPDPESSSTWTTYNALNTRLSGGVVPWEDGPYSTYAGCGVMTNPSSRSLPCGEVSKK